MKKPIALLVVVALAVGGALLVRQRMRQAESETGVVRVSGNIEITDAEVSFKIPGRVVARLVDEGEPVRAGQVVAELDKADLAGDVALRQAELEAAQAALSELEAGSRPEEIGQAEAHVAAAQSRVDELAAGSRPQEIAASAAAVQFAQADAERVRIDYERLEKLQKEDRATLREFEVARASYEMAKAKVSEAQEQFKLVKEGPRKETIEQAKAALAEAKQKLALVKAGPRKETIEQARARVSQADAALKLAQTRLGYATLVSPLTGLVLSKNIEPGEYVAPGTPVVTVGDLSRVWVRAYINSPDLERVKPGQSARVTTDAGEKVYQGRVSFISSEAEFTPKTVQTPKERVKLVYRVKIDIDNPHMELKPGMPVDAEIAVDSAPSTAPAP